MQLLELMLADMKSASILYKPTNFWEMGLPKLIDDIKVNGLDNFRSHESAHFFYVPLYSEKIKPNEQKYLDENIFPFLDKIGTGRLGNELRNILNGYSLVLADYKMFLLSDKPNQSPVINYVSESNVGNPFEHFTFDEKKYSKPFLNYLRMLNCLKQNVDTSGIKNVFEIGGGYGALGEIILKSINDSFYLNIDIPPLAWISTYYLSQVFGEDKVLTYRDSRKYEVIDVKKISKDYRCAVICPWQLPKLKGEFDLFVNSMSFQEMEPAVVCNYLTVVQNLTKRFILLRSSKYGKGIAKGDQIGVKTPITNDQIIRMIDKFSLLARDSLLYGFQNPKVNFYSEVMCFSKNT